MRTLPTYLVAEAFLGAEAAGGLASNPGVDGTPGMFAGSTVIAGSAGTGTSSRRCFSATSGLTISVLSALADVADEHELNTGTRQEAMFYAARTFFVKLSSALGHLIAGVALDVIAFPTGAKPGQVAQEVLTSLGLVEGPFAAVPAMVGIFFYARFQIGKARLQWLHLYGRR